MSKGEKYKLTDYAIAASQRLSDERLNRVHSYDINCMYHKNFFIRLPTLPAAVSIGIHPERWRFVIPKLHILGHEQAVKQILHFTFSQVLGRRMGKESSGIGLV